MKKRRYGSDDIISIYKFMNMCGLYCKVKGNICISHEIMMRKLRLRGRQFPDKICIPTAISFDAIKKDEVKSGNIVLVIDDCKKVIPYYRPHIKTSKLNYDLETREKVMQSLIENNNQDGEKSCIYVDGEKLTVGFANYIIKKEKKKFDNNLDIDLDDYMFNEDYEDYDVTEKKFRPKILERKKNRY